MPAEEPVVTYEVEGPIAVISLNRPRYRNAQNSTLLYALDDAFARFAADDDLRVAVLAGAGDHFSGGHDLGTPELDLDVSFDRRSLWWDHVDKQGAERTFAREEEMYLGLYRRWRDLPKPTIATVQGACIAGALKLVWACDLIVAADDAFFAEPIVLMGVPGGEVFKHPWEVGVRQAKEMLFTGEPIDAARALSLGMVNRVVARGELRESTMELAAKIAEMPRLGLALAKRAVNAAEDAMGQRTAMDFGYALHQLAHADNEAQRGDLTAAQGIDAVRKKLGRG